MPPRKPKAGRENEPDSPPKVKKKRGPKKRGVYEPTITRMYAEGHSLRAIAAVLGISFQRVHQLMGGSAPTYWRQGMVNRRRGPLRICSFCSKNLVGDMKFVSGPGEVCICEECIGNASSVIAGTGKWAGPFQPPTQASAEACSFCGTKKRGIAKATASGHHICAGCLELAGETIARP